ncbi:MBL fold metallo-hydrolase [Ancylomarina sp. 16SWW S1-10-2]|uniref:MBL fold metallo-hydrolase n=1 Tax=Ancylomarina sp. 16SWW S1-10-2 TaxID=2499681 RepID=UPI0012ADD403|nr:MBL fold metallo-hydrolase [Ancylomarina sp. 16SWW S1-10-2]MRT94479.1 MBL fold metallo-hydrolase [Ancylomarina sp. 16SWW S1-10-2]
MEKQTKITILCENETSKRAARFCRSEWGFSAFVETEQVKILLDTGHTDLYKQNAKALKIDLNQSDFVVLSHHHWDHTSGMLSHEFKEKKKLILHPDVLDKISTEKAELFNRDFDIIATKTSLEFAPGIFFLGQIPRKMSFEKGEHKGDLMLDDTAIAIKTKKGLIVLTGCSHSGICNICEYAKEVTGQELYAVVGGFHLTVKNDAVVRKTIEYFKTQNIEHLYPMHCVDFPTLARFYNEFDTIKYATGDVIEL